MIKKKSARVKILGDGDLSKKLNVSAHAFSKSAKEKIEAAGGTVTIIDGSKVDEAPEAASAK